MTTKITSPRVLEALPDGEYRNNDIVGMYFRIEDGVVVCRNGKVKTFEQFHRHFGGGSIIGPLPDTLLTPEEKEMVEKNIKLT